MTWHQASHVRVDPTIFQLPSSSVESRCGACTAEGGIGRRAGGRRPAWHARARGRWRGPRSGAGGRKHRRSRCRPKSDPLTHALGPCSPRSATPSRSPWAELLLWCRGTDAPTGLRGEREGRELGRRGRHRTGLWVCLRYQREAAEPWEGGRGGRRMDRGAGGRRHFLDKAGGIGWEGARGGY
jgi:hypothetical protein